ncbi:MAG: hypothetical protein IT235_07090 [Bacteroidia bacterium]|nr:hypothetical protein [Bacteroidia bacterium]
MDKNQIRKDIESLIDNIKVHFDNALDHDHIPQLELETIVNKIEKLHQKAIILHYLNERHSIELMDDSDNKVTTNTDSSSQAPVQTDLFGSTVVSKTSSSTTAKSALLSEKKQEPITDINTAIGINEKFQFINELFEGNMNEYTAAISQLNNYASLAEAQSYLNSIMEIYKWKDGNPVSEKFIKIVRRKLL